MYGFVDRPVSQLNSNGQMLLQAMRIWVSRASQGECCCTHLRDLFAAKGFPKGVAGFGLMMQALQRGARRNISFLPPGCGKIGEDEAVLFALVSLPLREQMIRHDAAHAMVTGAYLEPFLKSVEALGCHLLNSGGLPAMQASGAYPWTGRA